MSNAPTRAWISRTAAAKRLGIRRDTIDGMIARGLLRTVNLNGHIRITHKSLEKLANDPPPRIRTEVA